MTAPQQAPGPRHFLDELAQLKQKLLDMSAIAERLVERSIKALLDHDREVAEEVISGDKQVNEFEVEIEKRAIRLLALQQPMARDLRFLVGAIKIASDLERVGDHAVNIAQSAVRLVDYGGRLTPGTGNRRHGQTVQAHAQSGHRRLHPWRRRTRSRGLQGRRCCRRASRLRVSQSPHSHDGKRTEHHAFAGAASRKPQSRKSGGPRDQHWGGRCLSRRGQTNQASLRGLKTGAWAIIHITNTHRNSAIVRSEIRLRLGAAIVRLGNLSDGWPS
jgi:Phosphate uptake regulator